MFDIRWSWWLKISVLCFYSQGCADFEWEGLHQSLLKVLRGVPLLAPKRLGHSIRPLALIILWDFASPTCHLLFLIQFLLGVILVLGFQVHDKDLRLLVYLVTESHMLRCERRFVIAAILGLCIYIELGAYVLLGSIGAISRIVGVLQWKLDLFRIE